MRVWSPPCYLHYSVFCVVTRDQVLAWFRSSPHSDPLRRSCLFSLATEKASATQGRCSPWKEKKKKKKNVCSQAKSCGGKNRVCTKPNFLHMVIHKFYVPFLFTSDDYVVLRFVGDNNNDRSWPCCGVLDILFLNGEKT